MEEPSFEAFLSSTDRRPLRGGRRRCAAEVVVHRAHGSRSTPPCCNITRWLVGAGEMAWNLRRVGSQRCHSCMGSGAHRTLSGRSDSGGRVSNLRHRHCALAQQGSQVLCALGNRELQGSSHPPAVASGAYVRLVVEQGCERRRAVSLNGQVRRRVATRILTAAICSSHKESSHYFRSLASGRPVQWRVTLDISRINVCASFKQSTNYLLSLCCS
mmetsp:Transcript_6476/g.15766  ORF Transcript_6476/g.15766 Transcript_6476/m.15766 type:complete len:215 (+) Transcript_6476:362-1006(+)